MIGIERTAKETAILSFLLALTACAGPSIAVKESVQAHLASQDYAGAASELRWAKSEYGSHNAVLYYLDLGMVHHYSGNYKKSDKGFDKAEKRMDELYTKSAAQLAGMMIINDTTADYAGEPFERALACAIRALNYRLLGQFDDAMVEVRKAEEFLDMLSRDRGTKPVYRDDAYVRYFDSLFYEDAGQTDDARIARDAAMKAFGWYSQLYRISAPVFNIQTDPQTGEVILIHYTGLAPRKLSRTYQIAWNQVLFAVNGSIAKNPQDDTNQRVIDALRAGIMGKSVTVSFPEFYQPPYHIVGSEIAVGDRITTSQLMEDISAISMRELSAQLPAIKARSLVRAGIKYILTQNLIQKSKQAGSLAENITSFLANAADAESEVADTRSWTTAPARILMARLAVPEGTYPVTVRLKDSRGSIVSTHTFENVVIQKGKRTYLTYATAS